jgi:ABC-type nickel/cobalt efflux system permease component RcnA
MLSLISGFVASVTHVVTGPDHLAAVMPLAIDSRKKSGVIGLFWGVGHTLGMLLIGFIFILFRNFISIDTLSAHSDTIVGLLLIGIGSWAIYRVFHHHSHRPGTHTHFHADPFLYAHSHSHSHDAAPDHKHMHVEQDNHFRQKLFTALSIGIIHGFSGFSHLFALLPSLALPGIIDSLLYLGAFALGTILTMILFSFILGFVAFKSLVSDKLAFLKWFSVAGGTLAIGIGILWLIHPF